MGEAEEFVAIGRHPNVATSFLPTFSADIAPAEPWNPSNIDFSKNLNAQIMRSSGGLPGQGSGGLWGIEGLGRNIDSLRLLGGGLSTAAGLYTGLKALSIAKQQLKFSKNMANANLANQTQSYNTSIADRARARGAFEGQSQAQVDEYVAKNSLKDRTV